MFVIDVNGALVELTQEDLRCVAAVVPLLSLGDGHVIIVEGNQVTISQDDLKFILAALRLYSVRFNHVVELDPLMNKLADAL